MSFKTGRTGRGAAYVSDKSGSHHALRMQWTSRALAPLGVIAAWYVADLAGKPYEAARAALAHPLPALALIAFIIVSAYHMALGAETIIEDYVHDEAMKARALIANKWLSVAIGAVWVLGILLIAAPK
jgi:succinate dehydrogenase / fumarate reductase, membrane anchor subunit